jgi:hypothetical protein
MVERIDIERALDRLTGDESGFKFQSLAVVLAKLRWPELIACERHNDRGLDAHAPASASHDGRGKDLACSTTGTLDKLTSDAEKVQRHYSGERAADMALDGVELSISAAIPAGLDEPALLKRAQRRGGGGRDCRQEARLAGVRPRCVSARRQRIGEPLTYTFSRPQMTPIFPIRQMESSSRPRMRRPRRFTRSVRKGG